MQAFLLSLATRHSPLATGHWPLATISFRGINHE